MSIINIKKKYMKKTLIIVAFATFIFTSCKKDYNCSCDTIITTDKTFLGGSITTNTTNVTTVINETSSKATTACDLMDEPFEFVGTMGNSISGETVCSIK